MTLERELDRRGLIIAPNEGTSMLPLLREGRDLMVIRRKPPEGVRRYDAVLFKRGERYVLHRVLRVRPDGCVLCGDHQYRREFGVGEAQILGVLTAVVRDGREISVTDPRMRLYVHLWCDLFWIRAAILFAKALPGRILRRLRAKAKRG